MILLDADNAADYLQMTGRIDRAAKVRVELLAGGVSNIVLRIDPEGGESFVLKQSRERLRTDAPWFSRLDRIWRETAVMSVLGPLLPSGAVPGILFEDRENFLFAMQAADPRHVVWKEELLSGRTRPEIALRLAGYLSTIHARTQGEPTIAREFDDREIFVQLRVDPFYRYIASVHADLRPCVEGLIDEMWHTRGCLVHADFSPKNVLVTDSALAGDTSEPRITLIDFETGHYGDPAFDLGFFLSHLLLKAVRAGTDADRYVQLARTFWDRYAANVASVSAAVAFEPKSLERRAVANLAGCALARIDGTSPIGYLPDPERRDLVRQFCRGLFLERVDRLAVAFSRLESAARTTHR